MSGHFCSSFCCGIQVPSVLFLCSRPFPLTRYYYRQCQTCHIPVERILLGVLIHALPRSDDSYFSLLTFYPFIHPSIHPSIHSSIHASMYPPNHLCIHLSIHSCAVSILYVPGVAWVLGRGAGPTLCGMYRLAKEPRIEKHIHQKTNASPLCLALGRSNPGCCKWV